MMRFFKGRKILSLTLCLLLAVSIMFCPPTPRAKADTIDQVVSELQKVYTWLDKDPGGKEQVNDAKNRATNLPGVPGQDPWPGVFIYLPISQKLENSFGSEETAKQKIVDLLRGAAALAYSSNSATLKSTLERFKSDHQDTVTKILGSGFTIDDLYGFLLAAKNEVPNAITEDISGLIAIASGDYSGIRNSLKKWAKIALENAATGDYAIFKTRLSEIGWSIDKLVDAYYGCIAPEVDPESAAEIALLKAYVRSETRFIKDGNPVPSGTDISLYVGDTLDLKLSILGYNWAGDVLNWAAKNPDNPSQDTNVVTINNRRLTANTAGEALLIAYNKSPNTDWAYKGKIIVSSRPSGGPSGGAAPPTTPTTPPAEEKPGRADITSGTTIEKTTAPDGTVTLSARVDAAAVNKVLAEKPGVKEVAVKLEAADRQEVNVPAQAFTTLAGYKAALVIESPAATVVLPGAAVNVAALAEQLGADAGKINIRVQVTKLPVSEAQAVAQQAVAQEAGLKAIGPVMEFSVIAQVEGKTVTVAFGRSRVRAEMALDEKDLSQVGNTARLGAYRQDETTGRLNYVPSRYDAATKRIIFLTRGFSRYAVLEYEKTFADIKDHWARGNIETLASHRVIKGVTPDNFEPERAVTRAEFAALLVRALHLVPGEKIKTFSDVAPGAWYADVTAIASSNGLIYGYEDGTFRPNEKISREEMAAMLVRALDGMGVETKAQPEILAKFNDAGEIQGWAKTVVSQAVASGLMLGTSETEFAPQDEATRAQAATVVYRLREKPEMWQ